MRKRISILYNIILTKLLGLLGFASSCIPAPAEYGSPYASFKVNGTVSSANTEMPLENIQVQMLNDTAFTDTNGHYEVESTGFPSNQVFDVLFTDVDSTQNGEFNELDTTAVFENPEFIGGNGWYDGEATQTLDITLEPKE